MSTSEDCARRSKTPFRRFRLFIRRSSRVLNRRHARGSKASDSADATEYMRAEVSPRTSPQFGLVWWTAPCGEELRCFLANGLKSIHGQLSSLLRVTAGDLADYHSVSGFARQVCPLYESGNVTRIGPAPRQTQTLTATGSKLWGAWWDGRGLLKVKIYDFAIYTNVQQLASSNALPHSPQLQSGHSPDAPPSRKRLLARFRSKSSPAEDGLGASAICKSVRSNNAVELSLTVRPSRDLPLLVMRNEYKRILQKRMRMLGGDPEDEALHTLMKYFNADLLPEGSTRRGCVKKGTMLHFSRSKKGALTAVANGQCLTTVQSPKLCNAVFDLYLGDAPVCKKAREVASRNFSNMASQPLSIVV